MNFFLPCFYAVPKAIPSSLYGGGEGLILLDNLHCSGDEDSLKDCTHDGVGEFFCYRHKIAGILCSNGE